MCLYRYKRMFREKFCLTILKKHYLGAKMPKVVCSLRANPLLFGTFYCLQFILVTSWNITIESVLDKTKWSVNIKPYDKRRQRSETDDIA